MIRVAYQINFTTNLYLHKKRLNYIYVVIVKFIPPNDIVADRPTFVVGFCNRNSRYVTMNEATVAIKDQSIVTRPPIVIQGAEIMFFQR